MNVVQRLAELAQIGRHEGGIDRRLGTISERKARECFATWAREAGYALAQDEAANLFARREGRRVDLPPILVGSHLDTVPTGGAYDGAYGVAGALCALELLDVRGVTTVHPVEAVAWAGEEGSRFPLGCLGSSVFAGLWNARDALDLADPDGVSLREALQSPEGGLLPGVPARERNVPAAYLELHVEQGPVLEHAGVRLGVVTSIAAQRRYRITVSGKSGHAGTVPMERRSDALSAAAELVLLAESTARSAGGAVATVGQMTVQPGGTNVIPASVVFSLDVRSADEERLSAIARVLRDGADRSQRERGVRVRIEQLEARGPAIMDERLRAAVYRAIASMNEGAMDVSSGAGHDAMCLARIAPAAMIFVPSIGGASHVGDERTADEDLERGIKALAAALVEVDAVLEQK